MVTMEELHQILVKYKDLDVNKTLSTYEGLKSFSEGFYNDVAEIYDVVTRVKNYERNPSGYNYNDAPILGLLVRIWKLLKEIIHYYEDDNAEIISHLDRQVIEAAVTAKYLLKNSVEVIEDYRKCSYKNRLRIIEEAKQDEEFYKNKAGIRLLEAVKKKMELENLTTDSFEMQKRNKWKLQGKSFYQIFSEIEREEHYKLMYGIPSESIHGSWNESIDFDLIRNDDGTFSPYPFYKKADIRFVTPLLGICHDAYTLWLKRIDALDEYLIKTFQWIMETNGKLYLAFEELS